MTSGIGLGDNGGMTIATPERYAQMLDAARRGGYAYPAINVTSTQTLNAALQGFAEAESDGIIQVSVGGAAYFSGQRVNDRVTGSLAFAAFAHEVAAKYPNITIALHTDHCAKQYLDEWVRLLLDHEVEQVKHGQEPTFQSHMWDGSTVPLDENLDIAEELLDEIQTTVALAIKAGEMPDPAHSLDVAPGKPFALVFHGGSGSASEEIAQAVSYGVVKMNIDTDTQYAFSRAVAGHMFSNYDSVLKIDGEVGNKKLYDPRSWGREAESAMAARVVEACKQLGSAGRALN